MSDDTKKVPDSVLDAIGFAVNNWGKFTIEVVLSEGSGKSSEWIYGTLKLTENNRLNPESYEIAIAWDENDNVEFDYYEDNWESIAELPLHLYFQARSAQIKQERAASDLFDECVRLKKEAMVPEWRPLSVLTMDAVKQHAGAWALRSGPAGLPELRWLIIETMPPDYKTPGICCPDNEGSKIPHYVTECRPVDSEGIPVPWAKVGL